MIAQINDNREVYCDTSFLCNEHENDASKIIVNLPKSLVSDDYFYYIVCKSPDNVIPEFAVPLLLKNGNELIYLIGSNIGSISGRWEFCIVVKSVELDESGDIGTNGLIAITDTFHGNVESGIINEGELGEQPMDPNLQLLYDELLALTAAIRPHLHDIAQLAEELKAYRDDAEDFKNDAQSSAATAQNAKDEAVNLLIVIQGISNDLDALVVQINSLVTGFNASKLDFDMKYADVLSKYNDFSTKYTDFLSKYNTIDDDVAAVAADKVTVQGILTTVQGIKNNIDQVKNDIELTKSSIDTIYADIIENYGGLANKIDKSQIVNDLVTGGADDVASAETVKILNGDKLPNSHNADVEAHPDIREQYGTIQTQTILENYLSSHNISPLAKRGKLDVVLKGMSAVNLVKNGNFANGVTGIIVQGFTGYTVSNGIFTGTAVANGDKLTDTSIPIISGNKYYGASIIKASNSLVRIVLFDGVNTYVKNHSGSGNYELISEIFIPANSTNQGQFQRIRDNNVSAWTPVSVCNSKLINLTALFGAGNEPTKEQCDLMFANYFEGLQGSSNIKVLSTGKNLVYNGNGEYGINGWSISSGCSLSIENGMFKVSTTGTSKAIYKEIQVKPNTDYYVSYLNAAGTGNGYLQIFDLNGANIRAGNGTFNSGNNNRIQLAVTMTAVGFIYCYKIQLEEGTTKTAYEPYRGTEVIYKTLDGQVISLHRLLNGVYDEITKDGKYIKQIGEYTLQASDIVNSSNVSPNTVYYTRSFSDLSPKAVSNAIDGTVLMNGWKEILQSDATLASGNGGFYAYNGIFYFVVTSGTYPNLAAAQSALAGTKIVYELAQPQILDTNAAPLIAEPNGHVFISSDGCMPENTISYPLNLGAVQDGQIEGLKEISNLINAHGLQINSKVAGYAVVANPDANQMILSGFYRLQGTTVNFPDNANFGNMIVSRGGDTVFQILSIYNTEQVYIRKGYALTGTPIWRTWVPLVNSAQPAWITATLQNGWTGIFRYRKTQDGQLELNWELTPGTLTPGTVIAQLPSEYAIARTTALSSIKSTDASTVRGLVVHNNSNITIRMSEITSSTNYLGSATLPMN